LSDALPVEMASGLTGLSVTGDYGSFKNVQLEEDIRKLMKQDHEYLGHPILLIGSQV
jgi:hypothetical protein